MGTEPKPPIVQRRSGRGSRLFVPLRRLAVALPACALAGALAAPPAQAVTLLVDRTDDDADATGCTGAPNDCSLRGAVRVTNAIPGADTIVLPAGSYSLTIAGLNEDAAGTGDLDVTDGLTIAGTGAASTIVDALGNDRVLDVDPEGAGIEVAVSDVTLRGGFSNEGGAVRSRSPFLPELPPVHLTLTRVTITDNEGGPGGGAISNAGDLDLVDCTVASNVAQGAIGAESFGGGLTNHRGTATIVGGSFTGNIATVGGAIWNLLGASLDVTGTVFSQNGFTHIANGVAIGIFGLIDGGPVTVAGSSFHGVAPEPFDIALMSRNAEVSVSESTFDGHGGAAVLLEGGSLHLEAATVSSNAVAIQANAEVSLRNCTITGNTGGGVFASGGPLDVESCTFTGNAGALSVGEADVRISNSVVDGECQVFAGTTLTSLGGNVESPGNTCGFTDPSDQVGVPDAGLGPLADNGGPTATHALLVSSPAIGAGLAAACPATDQRGVARPQPLGGECDAGAYERTGCGAKSSPLMLLAATGLVLGRRRRDG